MAVMSPAQFDETWSANFNAADANALVGLYESDGVLIPEPGGKPLVGHEAIAEFANGFFAMTPRIDLRTQVILERSSDAIVYSNWSMTGTGPDGPMEMEGRATVLLRRQADGSWLAAIDDPWSQG
ncbi:SgcJ/EcaC family oxidoreductase [Actinomycetospora sp.]|jgi:uncharacterized protein (TIGR02246 family)|uniref:YybH family protein n=1 Tax=Actinomycetospora sp. TaxID=1872135 RepID=UPI002F416ACF